MSGSQLFWGPMPTPEDEIVGVDENGFTLYAGRDGVKGMVPIPRLRPGKRRSETVWMLTRVPTSTT